MSVRLFLDGSNSPWAIVRCGACTDVNKYPATEAAQTPIQCKSCGHSMDVRGQVMTNAANRPDIISDDMLLMLTGAALRASERKGAQR